VSEYGTGIGTRIASAKPNTEVVQALMVSDIEAGMAHTAAELPVVAVAATAKEVAKS
jgi:hypothetical protein